MTRFEQLLSATEAARRRCLDAGLRSLLHLDEAVFIRAAQACMREDAARVARLLDYADGMRRNACSCFRSGEADRAQSEAWVIGLLGQVVATLGGLGGTAGLVGFLFAAETINMSENPAAGARNAARRRADNRQLRMALASLLDEFTDGELREGLVEAAAHHCYDLILGLAVHDNILLAEGGGEGSGDDGALRREGRSPH